MYLVFKTWVGGEIFQARETRFGRNNHSPSWRSTRDQLTNAFKKGGVKATVHLNTRDITFFIPREENRSLVHGVVHSKYVALVLLV